jgi:hypothetical protein
LPIAGPFYFALVDETETTFGPEHLRMDRYVFSARRILSESEKPKLELVIENPRIGLLSPLQKQWCWFSYDDGGTEVVPLFFGRIVGIPSDLQAETLTVTFIAWPTNYVKQLQKVAETLKVAPFYDPVFTDISQRDNPMSIFESHSKVVTVDPVTLVVSSSDILDAEDGNVDFTEDDHFYASLQVSPGAVPKTAVHVDATVSWTQTGRGYLDLTNIKIKSFSGDGIISGWPKPLSNVAPGLTVFNSGAIDKNNTNNATTGTITSSYRNTEKHHEDGDTLSASSSLTAPIQWEIEHVLTETSQTGILDPFSTDGDGDPSPTNIPASVNQTKVYALSYLVQGYMTVEYNAARPHTERLIFTLKADVQPTTLDPLVTEDSETITISGSDVGMPIIELLNWTTISGSFVSIGTIIFPDDPALPGGRTAQVATVAGTAGTEEPEFSDVVGDLTIDGGVTWASLGTSAPTESAPDWTGVSNIPAGTIILPRRPIFTTWLNYTRIGREQEIPQGSPISEGLILQAPNGSFQVCTQSGTTVAKTPFPSFSTTWGVSTTDNTVTWKSLGMTLPTGTTFFLATTGGTTGAQYVIPAFDTTLHAPTTDGTVTWRAIGAGEIPAGGTPGNVTASSYFTTDRGRRSVDHLICRARARLRYASRAVTSTFECSYARGEPLRLRNSVTLHDYRLPSGLIAGKVTGTELFADGGTFACRVSIQSAVGNETVISEVADGISYVNDGYVTDGYAFREGRIVLLTTLSDVGYTPLVAIPDEDGIRFPLEKTMIVVSEEVRGSLAAQRAGIEDAFKSMAQAANPGEGGFGLLLTLGPGGGTLGGDIAGDIARQKQIQLLNSNSASAALKRNPIWYDLVLKPLNGSGSFNHVYHLKCTTLGLPRMIDLQEESTS